MSFKFVKSLSGENFPLMTTKPTTASTAIAADIAVNYASGKIVVNSATNKPAFISAGAVASSATPTETPVQAILPHYIWETTFSADAAGVNMGNKVTLTADGQQVTATTASGVATIVQMFGTAAGSKVWVRFE